MAGLVGRATQCGPVHRREPRHSRLTPNDAGGGFGESNPATARRSTDGGGA